MTSFKLKKKSANHVLVKYHIVDNAGTICGSVAVSPEEESALLKCWAGPRDGAATTIAATAAKQTGRNLLVAAFKSRGAVPAAPAADEAAAARRAISAALLRGPRLSKQALLRS